MLLLTRTLGGLGIPGGCFLIAILSQTSFAGNLNVIDVPHDHGITWPTRYGGKTDEAVRLKTKVIVPTQLDLLQASTAQQVAVWVPSSCPHQMVPTLA